MTRPPSATAVALAGGGLIAVTYGLARFVLGLFLPGMRAELGFGPELAGIIGALPFISYVAAILLAPRYTAWLGVQRAAVGAGLCALAGVLAVSLAPGALTLGVGVAVCGISTGLSSPVLAQAVQWLVPPAARGRTNAAINAATSLGIMAATPALLLWTDAWRGAYAGFAGAAALAALAATLILPAGHGLAAPRGRLEPGELKSLLRLSLFAGGMGLASSAYWVFGPDLAVTAGGLAAGDTAWLWLAVGGAGLLGGLAGDAHRRWGFAASHAVALAILATAIAVLAAAPAVLPLAIASAALFGFAYMALTGLFLVASVEALPARPATGPVGPFLAIACGQALGSTLAGWSIGLLGHRPSFALFAAFALALAGLAAPVPGRPAAPRAG